MIDGNSFAFLLLAHTAAALFMTGLIWFVQVVHYPLFAAVPPTGFATYENLHVRRTTFVVAPVMLFEFVTGLLLLPAAPSVWVWSAAILLGIVWISTILLQVPQHRVLERGLDLRAQRMLVQTNWVRTAAWTLRSIILLGMIIQRVA